jgi:FkbH-like protein
MIITPKLEKPFRKWFEKQMEVLDLKRKKCIVLDCDNTLWGGVVGEEGTFGIKLGMDYPGNCFKSFQYLLLSLSKKGVILTICSKNNLKDVQDVWENNPHNVINDKVLSAYRINWQDKASNIKSIAEELNIGTDSIVFIDDNPIERGLIKELLPEVEVPDFPKKPYELVDFFWQIYHDYFAVYELYEEDLRKTEQYKENFFRNESKKAFANIDDYLASLNIEIDIMKANEANLPRIAQMTQKTNQFNLTTKHYTEEQLREMAEKGANIYCANVKDKFGDNGITIAAIFIENNNEVHLDSYLLSCRILGREIEKVTLLKLIEEINRDKNKQIKAQFIPSKKNSIAADFLDNIGFVPIKTDEETGTKHYVFDVNKKPDIKTFYRIKFI